MGKRSKRNRGNGIVQDRKDLLELISGELDSVDGNYPVYFAYTLFRGRGFKMHKPLQVGARSTTMLLKDPKGNQIELYIDHDSGFTRGFVAYRY